MARPQKSEYAAMPTKVSATVEAKQTQKDDIIASADVIEMLEKTPQKFKRNKETPIEKRIRHYKLAKKSGITRFIESSGFTVYDENTKRRREVRYCTNEGSIFKDEQGEFAMREPVKFKDGEMFVSYEYPALIELLDKHPDNVKNGGSLFYEVNKVDESKAEAEKIFKAADVITRIRTSSLDDLMPIALHLSINTNQTSFEIKRDLVLEAQRDPDGFMKRMDSPLVKLKAVVQNALDFGIIEEKDSGIFWTDSQKLIITVPQGRNSVETMAVYFTTDRGTPVLEELQRQLSEI